MRKMEAKKKKNTKKGHFLYAVFKVFFVFHLKREYPIKGGWKMN